MFFKISGKNKWGERGFIDEEIVDFKCVNMVFVDFEFLEVVEWEDN